MIDPGAAREPGPGRDRRHVGRQRRAAAGARAIDVRVWGGIDLRLLPGPRTRHRRGVVPGDTTRLDLARRASSCLRPGASSTTRWGGAWGGGLVTTCGLSNVGRASEGHGLHGTYTARQATDIHVERATSDVTVTGTVEDPPFTLHRRDPHDARPRGAPGRRPRHERVGVDRRGTALYHVNIGAPLWDGDAFLETDAREVVPRDDDAAPGLETWDAPPTPPAGAPERVFEHVGASWARLTSPRLGIELTVRSSLPRLWQWVHPATGTLRARDRAGELLRARPRARHRCRPMPFLDPG